MAEARKHDVGGAAAVCVEVRVKSPLSVTLRAATVVQTDRLIARREPGRVHTAFNLPRLQQA